MNSHNSSTNMPISNNEPDSFGVTPFCLIIFGGTGDLSQQKLIPTLFHLAGLEKFPEKYYIIGAGRTKLDDNGYRNFIKELLLKEKNDQDIALEKFLAHIHYLQADIDNKKSYASLASKIESLASNNSEHQFNTLYYLAVPPSFFPTITTNIKEHKLNRAEWNPRIIIEKPFGTDKKSAIELNNILATAFKENQIYRIDHYLGKETVQNIIFFRFANSIFEPLWNRRYIDNVQITVAEDIGIGTRAAFYENAGVIRDIIQNHMLQLIALIAMEPPVGFEPDLIRNEKIKIFRSLQKMDLNSIAKNTIRGQYGAGTMNGSNIIGYREEKNVDKHSEASTFFAAKFHIDNWRWSGVPFYVRAGKRMPARLTEIVIQFKQPPLSLFSNMESNLKPNALILAIQPTEAITLNYSVKNPKTTNTIHPVNMKFCYQEEFNYKNYPAYSRLLLDCMRGDFTLFVRQDGVEAMWDFIDPIIQQWETSTCPIFPNYSAGSWGPEAATDLLKKDGRDWITGSRKNNGC